MCGTIRTGGKTYDLTGETTITISTKSIGISDSTGGWFLDPKRGHGALLFLSPFGVGVFSWEPTKGGAAEAVRTNVDRVAGIIRGEEEKAFALIKRAKPIIDRRLNGKSPTNDDFAFLWDTHGIHRDLVDDLREKAAGE